MQATYSKDSTLNMLCDWFACRLHAVKTATLKCYVTGCMQATYSKDYNTKMLCDWLHAGYIQ